MVRSPAVAGMFYDSECDRLLESIERAFVGQYGPGHLPNVAPIRFGNILGLVAPHAGYTYSGGAAACSYDALAADGLPGSVVIIGPNHHGAGHPISLCSEGEWCTPLGSMRIDTDITNAVVNASQYAVIDDAAHVREHSIEVQLPFLQYLATRDGSTQIVPITISHLDYHDIIETVRDLGGALAAALKGRSAIVIASTDFTHYESADHAMQKDDIALEKIIELDPTGLVDVTYERNITMCGVTGTAVMLEACKLMGASSARKLTYYSSGDVTGDRSQVVGYASAAVEKGERGV